MQKYEELHSDSQYPHKKPDMVAGTCNPSSGRQRLEGHWGLVASLSTISEEQVQWDNLSKNIRWGAIEEDWHWCRHRWADMHCITYASQYISIKLKPVNYTVICRHINTLYKCKEIYSGGSGSTGNGTQSVV